MSTNVAPVSEAALDALRPLTGAEMAVLKFLVFPVKGAWIAGLYEGPAPGPDQDLYIKLVAGVLSACRSLHKTNAARFPLCRDAAVQRIRDIIITTYNNETGEIISIERPNSHSQ